MPLLPDNIKTKLQAWLPRILLLFAVWGVAVFLWATFGAWTRQQHLANELHIAEASLKATDTWLKRSITILNRLSTDERLSAGLELSAGVESLPVQRVLYEFSYLTRQPEVYVIDLLRNRIGRTAGAAPLPEGTLDRLARLPTHADQTLLAIGQRNAQILLLRRVKAPLPQRLYVALPISLGQLGSGMPVLPAASKRVLNLALPHVQDWVLWDGNNAFVKSSDLTQAMDSDSDHMSSATNMTMLLPLTDWPGVKIAVAGPSALGSRMLPQFLVLIWALMMSAMILLKGTNLGQQMHSLVGDILSPLMKSLSPFASLANDTALGLKGHWKSATLDEPLLNGPGELSGDDFIGSSLKHAPVSPQTEGFKRKPFNIVRKLGNETVDIPNVERRTQRRGKDRTPVAPRRGGHVEWKGPAAAAIKPRDPEKEKNVPTPHESKDNNDYENMHDVVKECIRQKQIVLLYQPIYRAGDNMPVMHEVFSRLVDPRGRIISPAEFLPVAQRHRMTLELDLTVLRKIVHEHFNNGNSPLTPLALNISSTSLDGIAYLQEMVNQGARVLQRTSFEVSSQEMIRDPKALKLLKELQKHGANLAVDYFGGGTAMLEASRSLGFNYVKMDCNRFMESDEAKKNLIMLCNHARQIGLPVIIEKVGDKVAYDFARRAGAEFLQGYALSRPQKNMVIAPLTPSLDGVKNLAAL